IYQRLYGCLIRLRLLQKRTNLFFLAFKARFFIVFIYFIYFFILVLYFIKNVIYFNKLIDICINRQESQKVVDNYFVGTIRASRLLRYITLMLLAIKLLEFSNKFLTILENAYLLGILESRS